MAVSMGAIRESQAEQVVLERMTKIVATQLSVQEGYTPDPEIAEVIKRLTGYLQHVVALVAMMVPPTEESKLREKRRREALAQATNMVLMVSIFACLNPHQATTDRPF